MWLDVLDRLYKEAGSHFLYRNVPIGFWKVYEDLSTDWCEARIEYTSNGIYRVVVKAKPVEGDKKVKKKWRFTKCCFKNPEEARKVAEELIKQMAPEYGKISDDEKLQRVIDQIKELRDEEHNTLARYLMSYINSFNPRTLDDLARTLKRAFREYIEEYIMMRFKRRVGFYYYFSMFLNKLLEETEPLKYEIKDDNGNVIKTKTNCRFVAKYGSLGILCNNENINDMKFAYQLNAMADRVYKEILSSAYPVFHKQYASELFNTGNSFRKLIEFIKGDRSKLNKIIDAYVDEVLTKRAQEIIDWARQQEMKESFFIKKESVDYFVNAHDNAIAEEIIREVMHYAEEAFKYFKLRTAFGREKPNQIDQSSITIRRLFSRPGHRAGVMVQFKDVVGNFFELWISEKTDGYEVRFYINGRPEFEIKDSSLEDVLEQIKVLPVKYREPPRDPRKPRFIDLDSEDDDDYGFSFTYQKKYRRWGV